MNILMKNKPLYFNLVLVLTSLTLLATRQIPLSIILFIAVMVEVNIIIALRMKGNRKKAFGYMILFMALLITGFIILIFMQIDNDNFREVLFFIL